jgi:hypothetical protein
MFGHSHDGKSPQWNSLLFMQYEVMVVLKESDLMQNSSWLEQRPEDILQRANVSFLRTGRIWVKTGSSQRRKAVIVSQGDRRRSVGQAIRPNLPNLSFHSSPGWRESRVASLLGPRKGDLGICI